MKTQRLTQSQKLMVFVLTMSLYGLATLFTELIPSFQVGIVEFSVEYFLFIPLVLAMLFDPMSAALGAATGELVFSEIMLGQFGGLGELEKFITVTIGVYIAGRLVRNPKNRKMVGIAAISGVAIQQILGMIVGIVSAVRQYSILDYIFMVLALIGVSMPIFWMGLMLVLLFSVNLGWLPAMGMGDPANGMWDVISHMILPCFCLATIPMATFARITRSSMLEVVNSDSVKALRARGLREGVVIWKHALKNALPPIVTVLGLQLATAFTGAILTESIFSWPGMGTMIVSAIDNRDYALIQGVVLFTAIVFVVINLIVDVVYTIINPKVNYESGNGGR